MAVSMAAGPRAPSPEVLQCGVAFFFSSTKQTSSCRPLTLPALELVELRASAPRGPHQRVHLAVSSSPDFAMATDALRESLSSIASEDGLASSSPVFSVTWVEQASEPSAADPC